MRAIYRSLRRLSLVFFQQSRQAGRNPYTPLETNISILIFLILLLTFGTNERISAVPIRVRAAGHIRDVNIKDISTTTT